MGILALLVLPQPSHGQAAGVRGLSVEDLLSLEELVGVSVAPDGGRIAAVVRRSRLEGAEESAQLAGNGRADIWLFMRDGRTMRRLAESAGLRGGLWQPTWSPSGRYLAMLSNVGGDNVRLYLWDSATDQIRRVSDRGIDLMTDTRLHSEPVAHPLTWIGDSLIICGVLPEGRRPRFFSLDGVRRDYVQAAWRAQQVGREPTSSVLESGTSVGRESGTVGTFATVDVRSGAIRLLGEFLLDVPLVTGSLRRALPAGNHVALLIDAGPKPLRTEDALLEARMRETRLAMVELGPRRRARWVDSVAPLPGWNSSPGRWSPDGAHFAVIGTASGDSSLRSSLFLVAPATGKAYRITAPSFEVQSILLPALWENQAGFLRD